MDIRKKVSEIVDSGFSKDLYLGSLQKDDAGIAFMFDAGSEDLLVTTCPGFEGEVIMLNGIPWTVARRTHRNCLALRTRFPFTAPVPVLHHRRSIGLGDRLGIATAGHIQAIHGYDVKPVFAQQSIRELKLTERTFEDVLDCVSWTVFREGYIGGFGADGDHLKTEEEIEDALSSGYTMITLDCSEYIHNEAAALSDEEARGSWTYDQEKLGRYLDRSFSVGGSEIRFDLSQIIRASLIYDDAIAFAEKIYRRYIKDREQKPDFEISIDETLTPTTPEQHFYVASELRLMGVRPDTVAPRFVGEFQKGIDYIGDLEEFCKQFRMHAQIADCFGYKISVHSGSDKFSVFETVGKYTGGRFHLKTAGTNWLEAMRLVAEKDPDLYREIHRFALDTAFREAKAYYHVTTDLDAIPPVESLRDQDLPELFSHPDARQLIHITYGMILTARDSEGRLLFKDRLFDLWRQYAGTYAEMLQEHIGKHLKLLYRSISG